MKTEILQYCYWLDERSSGIWHGQNWHIDIMDSIPSSAPNGHWRVQVYNRGRVKRVAITDLTLPRAQYCEGTIANAVAILLDGHSQAETVRRTRLGKGHVKKLHDILTKAGLMKWEDPR